jgi:uncharacterized small protein (DUF1192 family)
MAFAASLSVTLWEHRNAILTCAIQHVVAELMADREVRPAGEVFTRGMQDHPFLPFG